MVTFNPLNFFGLNTGFVTCLCETWKFDLRLLASETHVRLAQQGRGHGEEIAARCQVLGLSFGMQRAFGSSGQKLPLWKASHL